jgi:epoxyqueuosine reductase
MLVETIRSFAASEGIPLWGTAAVTPLEPEGRRLAEWLARGLDGGLEYLGATAALRADPTRPGVLRAGARGAVLLGLSFARTTADTPAAERAVAAYLRGRDYHRVFQGVLRRLAARLRAAVPGLALRPFCDALPVLEKALAVRAGLGWQGRNTLLIHPAAGSTFVLGGLLLDRPLPSATPLAPACGECRRCIDACPTGALSLPGVLDAGRCLTRWSSAGLPPPAALPRGPYARSCDVCQDVCPLNAGPGPAPFARLYQRRTSEPGKNAASTGGGSSPSAGAASPPKSPEKSV